MKMQSFLLMMLLVAMAGCTTSYAQKPSGVESTKKTERIARTQLENIYGLEVKDKTLSVKIISNGCSRAKSFELRWQKEQVTILRLKADHCRRMPHKIWLDFDIPSQTKNFHVVNQFVR